MEKSIIRRELLAKRARMTPQQVWLSSRSIFKGLIQQPVFKKARNICCYLSFGNEVHTHGFVLNCLEANKTVAVPKVDKYKGIILSKFTGFSHVQPGYFRIPEPKENAFYPFDPDSLDLVVIPAVALDRQGNRLGFGAGYYDKFLSQKKKKLFLVGVVHHFQLLEQIPVCAHDISMHQVITGREIIYLHPIDD